MTSLERRALLGDAEAQRECTEKEIVLGCPKCGAGSDKITYCVDSRFVCEECGISQNSSFYTYDGALADWNTRPAPPIGRCGECKHSTNPAALTMIYGEPGTLTCHHGPCNRRNVNENDFCRYFEPKEEK